MSDWGWPRCRRHTRTGWYCAKKHGHPGLPAFYPRIWNWTKNARMLRSKKHL